MRFTPKSNEELQEMNLIKEGVYAFEIVNAVNKTSKAGNEMIELNLKVYDNLGIEKFLFDYLLESMPFKLKHFAETAGLLEKYEAGNLSAEDCMYKCGQVQIYTQKSNNGYSDKSAVKDYMVDVSEKYKEDNITKSHDAPVNEFIDDKIPF